MAGRALPPLPPAPDFASLMDEEGAPPPVDLEEEAMVDGEMTEDDMILGDTLAKIGLTEEEFSEAVRIVMNKL